MSNKNRKENFINLLYPYKFKCNKTLVINPDIAAFSKEIINTTIIKAFCKVKYREGSKKYEKAIEKGLDLYELYKNENNKFELWKKVG